jgi:hypothetical protein
MTTSKAGISIAEAREVFEKLIKPKMVKMAAQDQFPLDLTGIYWHHFEEEAKKLYYELPYELWDRNNHRGDFLIGRYATEEDAIFDRDHFEDRLRVELVIEHYV